MNYRHAFHAGNFADVHKHTVLTRVLVHLRVKPAAFRVIDTHAGSGRYDLYGAEANRGGEWHEGIERVWPAPRVPGAPAAHPLLAPYLDCLTALNPDGKLRLYPGSPLIAASMLRPHDRLVACESEPRAASALAAALRRYRHAKALAIDGWTALTAYVPPKERRGLVLIDPPFEEPADFDRLSGALSVAWRKWPTGIYLLWYPIKERAAPDSLARRLRQLGIPRLLRCELVRASARREAGLAGSGLIIVNPPFTLEQDLRILMPILGNLLAANGASRLDWLAGEPAAASQ
jgi:23S rRNA (adenine2030-N6)-methyltransferase